MTSTVTKVKFRADLLRGIFPALIAIAFLMLVMRATGLYTLVPDEYTYSRYSRLESLTDSPIPDYLYLQIFRVTNLCGDGFLGCARVLNSLFFVAASVYVYLVARRVCPPAVAVLVATLALLDPVNSVTAYYMPESLYYLGFWMLCWFVLERGGDFTAGRWAMIGSFVGLLALVKPHALFLMPPLALYGALLAARLPARRAVRWVTSAACFSASAIATKFAVGFLLAGRNGLTLFGTAYTAIAGAKGVQPNDILQLAAPFFENLAGHFLGLSLLYALPIAMAVYTLASPRREATNESTFRVAALATLVLFTLIPITALFTATVAGGPDETNARIHMRYYNFCFPLLLIVISSYASRPSSRAPINVAKVLIALPLALGSAVSAYTNFASFAPNFVDCPELAGLVVHPAVFFVLGIGSVATLLLWLWKVEWAAKVFLYVLAPLSIGIATYNVNEVLQGRLVPDVYDKAGRVTKDLLDPEDLSRLVLIGAKPTLLFRTLFSIDNGGATLQTLPEGTAADPSVSLSDGRWVLIIGDSPPIRDDVIATRFNGFTLAKAALPLKLDFTRTTWTGVVDAREGLATPESWGTWSIGSKMRLHFAFPLPRRFNVRLTASAFGPNVGETFVARAGASSVRFTMKASLEDVILPFETDGTATSLEIDVPRPTAPKAIYAASNDDRLIGLRLVRLAIERP